MGGLNLTRRAPQWLYCNLALASGIHVIVARDVGVDDAQGWTGSDDDLDNDGAINPVNNCGLFLSMDETAAFVDCIADGFHTVDANGDGEVDGAAGGAPPTREDSW